MEQIKVSDLATEFEIQYTTVVSELKKIGVWVPSADTPVDPDIAIRIRRRLQLLAKTGHEEQAPAEKAKEKKATPAEDKKTRGVVVSPGRNVSMVPTSQPDVTQVRISDLAVRMRSLVGRVQTEIIDPSRIRITKALERLEKAFIDSEAAISAAQAQVAGPRQEIERLLGMARDHLTSQNVFIPYAAKQVTKSTALSAGDGATPPDNRQALQEATSGIGHLKDLVEGRILKTMKPKNVSFPNSGFGGCVMILGGVIAGAKVGALTASYTATPLASLFGFIGGFLVIYLPIMLFLHWLPVQELRRLFCEAQQHAQHLTKLLDGHGSVPSVPGEISTKAPNSTIRTTLPT